MKLSHCSKTLNIEDWSSKIASWLLSVPLPLCYRYAIPLFTSCLAQNKITPSFSNWIPKTCLLFLQNLLRRCCWLSSPWVRAVIAMQYRCFWNVQRKIISCPPFLFGYPKTCFTIKMSRETSFLSGLLSDCQVLWGQL